MSAIPPLSRDKQTFGEQAEKTAHDPFPTVDCGIFSGRYFGLENCPPKGLISLRQLHDRFWPVATKIRVRLYVGN